MNPFAVQKAHWLKPLKTTRLPERLVFVTATWCEDEQVQADGRKRLRLLRCAVQRATWGGGEWTLRPCRVHDDPVMAKVELFASLSGQERTWIVGYDLSTILELINWWAEVDGGHVLAPTRWEADVVESGRRRQVRDPAPAPCVLSDPPLIIGGVWRGRSFVMVDSRNYVDSSIDEMDGVVFNPLHGYTSIDEYDYRQMDQSSRQCLVLRETVCHWLDVIRAHDLGTWSATASATAWNVFRRHFLRPKTLLCHRDGQALAYERWSYCQGQCAVAYVGAVSANVSVSPLPHPIMVDGVLHSPDGVTVLDVCSQYPYWLGTTEVPVRLLRRHDGRRLLDNVVRHANRVCMVHGRIRTDVPHWPCRVDRNTLTPVLGPTSEQVEDFRSPDMTVIYPVGVFEGVWIGDDVRQGVFQDRFEEVYQWWEYSSEVIGQDWLHVLWNLRKDAHDADDVVMEQLVKRLMNGLLGKFAQWSQRWESLGKQDREPRWGEWVRYYAETDQIERFRSLAGVVEQAMPQTEHCESMPAIAATITAAARWQMHALREQFGTGQWLYQGVDSLHVLGLSGLEPRQHDTRRHIGPGSLRYVSTHSNAIYLGRQTYCLDGSWTVSGIPGGQRWEDGPHLHGRHRDRAKTILNRGPGGGVYVRDWIRDLRPVDVGGVLLPTGWVEPYEVGR